MTSSDTVSEGVELLASIAHDMEEAVAGGMSWIDHSECREFVRRIRDAVPFVRDHVGTLATIHADEGSGWDALHAGWDTRRVNHSVAFYDDGVCTNQAESFFSRLRRMEIGTHHHIAGPYLASYATEAAWREDNRRVDNGSQAMTLTAAAMSSRVSRTWKGYWQRVA